MEINPPLARSNEVQNRSDRRPDGIQKGRKQKNFIWIILIIIVIALLGYGIYYLLRTPEFDEMDISPTTNEQQDSTPTEVVTPSPTSEPIDKSDINIDVLNGTGIGGEASYLQGKLRNAGYTEIDIGNASSQQNETTVVTFLKSVPDSVVSEITTLLKDSYKDVKVSTSDSGDYAIEIITGLRTGQSLPTSEPTQKPQPTTSATSSATPTP
jgi:hypothetical protein